MGRLVHRGCRRTTGASLPLVLAIGTLAVAPPGDVDAASEHRLLIRGPTVVTMDARHRVVRDGRVLIEDDRIAAVWRKGKRPGDVSVRRAEVVSRGSGTLLFPGLINVHNHPNFGVVEPWPAPSSHAIPEAGKSGSDPYANRYQWSGAGQTSPDEFLRLVRNIETALSGSSALDLAGEAVKYAEIAQMLGGATATQGAAPNPESDEALIHNIGNEPDGRIKSRVGPIDDLGGPELESLRGSMRAGQVDAWLVHLAEGVADADRRPGDPVSSRAEFETLWDKGLLTDMTAILHGTALERADFAAMRAAPTIRTDGTGDERGAKLVWSPYSNMMLYGQTTNVYEALAENVLVSLGTDWTPSGSRTLLEELGFADRALRDTRVLGGDRELVDRFAIEGRDPAAVGRAELALDRALVDMVTRNPALTLRTYGRVGSIEKGKQADLLMIRDTGRASARGAPRSVYRRLIDADESDVQLVTVGGRPLAGAVGLLSRLNPRDFEVITSSTGGYRKAVDVTAGPGAAAPEGDESFAQLSEELRLALSGLGGDNPPPGGGPADSANTYSYLKSRWAGGALAGASDADFRSLLEAVFGTDASGRLNLEAIELSPVLGPSGLRTAILDGNVDPSTGLLADPDPPFELYPANLNHFGPEGNPFAGLP